MWWWQRSSPAAEPPPPAPPASAAAGYLRLPALQRSIAPLAPSLRLSDQGSWIGSWRSPGFLGEMGHALDSAVPGGRAGGLATAGRPVPWSESVPLPMSPEEQEAVPEPRPTMLQRLFSPWRAATTTATAARPAQAGRSSRRAAPGQAPAATVRTRGASSTPPRQSAASSRGTSSGLAPRPASSNGPAPQPASSSSPARQPAASSSVPAAAARHGGRAGHQVGTASPLPAPPVSRAAPVVQRVTRRRVGTAVPVPPRPLPVTATASATRGAGESGPLAGPLPDAATPTAPWRDAPLLDQASPASVQRQPLPDTGSPDAGSGHASTDSAQSSTAPDPTSTGRDHAGGTRRSTPALRRPGLGAPLAPGSAAPSIQRTTTSSPLRPAAPVTPRTGLGPPLTPGSTLSEVDSITGTPAPGVSGAVSVRREGGSSAAREAGPAPRQQTKSETPQQATPQQTTPQQATPQQATPQQATPQQATPTPKQVVPAAQQRLMPDPGSTPGVVGSATGTSAARVAPVQRSLIGMRPLVPLLHGPVPVQRARTAAPGQRGSARRPVRQDHPGPGASAGTASAPTDPLRAAAATPPTTPSRTRPSVPPRRDDVVARPGAITAYEVGPQLQRERTGSGPGLSRRRRPRWWRPGREPVAPEVTGMAGVPASGQPDHHRPAVPAHVAQTSRPAGTAGPAPVQRATGSKPTTRWLRRSQRPSRPAATNSASSGTNSAGRGMDSAGDGIGGASTGMGAASSGMDTAQREPEAAGAMTSGRRTGGIAAARDAAPPRVPERIMAVSSAPARHGLPVLQRVRSSTTGSPGALGSAAVSEGEVVRSVRSSAENPSRAMIGTPPANDALPPTVQRSAGELPLHRTGVPMAPAPAGRPHTPISRDTGVPAVQRTSVTHDNGVTAGQRTPVARDNGARSVQQPVQRDRSRGSQPPSRNPAKQDKNTAPGQRELDELARRLYGPISRRLRAELRLDRERAGRFTGRSASGR